MSNTIGIDIGGTKINGVVFDGKKSVKELTIVTPKTLVEFKRNLIKLVDFLSADKNISAVGIGMAGVIDTKRKVAVYSPNIKYINNFGFSGLFGRKIKIAVANDAKCFALAEAQFGQGKNCGSVVGVILGTGVGSGFVLNGKIYTGEHYGAGEIGQMIYDGKNTFESLFQKARDARNNKQLSQIAGVLLGNICRAYDPNVVVLGGGVALDKKRKFVDGAKIICAKMLSSYRIKPRIAVSKLKNAGAIGAALLVK
jgi:predicted NBD/HSP70 family sugar kinase